MFQRQTSPELALATDGEQRVAGRRLSSAAGARSTNFSVPDLAAVASNVFCRGYASTADQARRDVLRGGEPGAGPRTGLVQSGFEIMFPELTPAVHERLAAPEGQAHATFHPDTPPTVTENPEAPPALPPTPDTAAGSPTAQDDENAADDDDDENAAVGFATADGMWQTSNHTLGLGLATPPATPPDPAPEANPQATPPGAVAADDHPLAGRVLLPCPHPGVQEGFANGRPLREICHLHGFRPELVPEEWEWEERAHAVQGQGAGGRAATRVVVHAPNAGHAGIPEPCEAASSILDVQSTTEARSWQQTMRMLGPAGATNSQPGLLQTPSPPSTLHPGHRHHFCPPASPQYDHGTHANTDEGLATIKEEEAVLAPEEVNAMIVRMIGLQLRHTGHSAQSGDDHKHAH